MTCDRLQVTFDIWFVFFCFRFYYAHLERFIISCMQHFFLCEAKGNKKTDGRSLLIPFNAFLFNLPYSWPHLLVTFRKIQNLMHCNNSIREIICTQVRGKPTFWTEAWLGLVRPYGFTAVFDVFSIKATFIIPKFL